MYNHFINNQFLYTNTIRNQINQILNPINPMIEQISKREYLTRSITSILSSAIIPQINIPTSLKMINSMNWQLAQVMPPYIPSTFIPQTNVPIYPQPLYINQLTSHFTYYNSHYAFMNNIASVLSQTLNTQFNKTFSFLNHQQNFIYKNYPINYENIIAYNRILTDISPTTLKTYQELSPILQIIIDLPEKDKKSILKALFHKISFRIDSLSKTVQKKINSILSIEKAKTCSGSILITLEGINNIYSTQNETLQNFLSSFGLELFVILVFLQAYIIFRKNN